MAILRDIAVLTHEMWNLAYSLYLGELANLGQSKCDHVMEIYHFISASSICPDKFNSAQGGFKAFYLSKGTTEIFTSL